MSCLLHQPRRAFRLRGGRARAGSYRVCTARQSAAQRVCGPHRLRPARLAHALVRRQLLRSERQPGPAGPRNHRAQPRLAPGDPAAAVCRPSARTACRADSGPVTAAFIEQQYEIDAGDLGPKACRQMSPDIARLLLTLSDEQVSEFFAETRREKCRTGRGVFRACTRSAAQEAGPQHHPWIPLVYRDARARSRRPWSSRYTAGMHDLTEQWLQRREAWQSAFRELLENRTGNAGV